MERYHIFKLGLAITFYAAYCIRPMLVYSLEADNNLENNKNILNPEHEYFQYFHGVEGLPGRDFPVYSFIPRTTFNCRGIESGYYADLETDCQVFHICEEGKKISFLCPNGTIFQQSELICEWWNKVNCTNSPSLYEESAERLQNDNARRKASRRIPPLDGAEMSHGAVMRIEERTSVRATKNGKEFPVRQKTQRTQRIKNQRIPDNNDIEQQIEEAESNNRHLANAQNLADQNPKHPNHNYNAENDNDYRAINKIGNKQTKKDIDRETGNFFNQNYDQGSNRHSKKVEQAERNNLNFGAKTVQPKTTTLKEYHVEFGPTSSGIDSSTQGYETSDGENVLSTQNFRADSPNRNFATTNKNPSFSSAKSNLPQKEQKQQITNSASTSTNSPLNQEYNSNNEYGSKVVSNSNILSSSLTPRQPTQIPPTNGKSNRGSVRYRTNSNYFDNQQSKDDQNKDNFKSTPVTTYSPPVKFSGSSIPQSSRINSQEPSRQANYDLPFPKHKSELSNHQGSVTAAQPQQNSFSFASRTSVPSQSDIVGSSTEASFKFIPNQTPVGFSYNKNSDQNISEDSQETQVPEESSSFVKGTFNSITDNSLKTSSSPYPNHKSTYSDIKDISYLEAPKLPSISSITAHLVTTQPINNGKPFIGSRVGTTLLPNQPTTHSKYTYLPTTSSSKPTVIFGVIRHSSTTELPPYGPPEIFNLGASTEYPISDNFNVGNSDKTRPAIETTTLVTNPVPTDNFNLGSTDSTIKPNVFPTYGTTTLKPLNILIPEEGTLNVGVGETNIGVEHPSYKSDTENPISDRFNIDNINQDSQTDENNKLLPHTASNFGSYSGKRLCSGPKSTRVSDRFNVGNTDGTRPTIETTTLVTNAVPTDPFNVGNTDTTLKPNVVPSFGTTTVKPLEIYVPEQGSLNLGQNTANVEDDYNGLEPVNEPPFIKKTVPLLYSNQNTPISTDRTVDHATVYGTFVSVTQRSAASSNKTPYSPTVPTVTPSPSQSSAPAYSSTSSRTPKGFNQGVPIRFANGQDKISVQLSRNVGGQTQINEQPKSKTSQQPFRKINAVVRVGDVQQFDGGSTTTEQGGISNQQVQTDFSTALKSKTERPRPFARTLGIDGFNTGSTVAEQKNPGTNFPAYHISSARPFGVSQTTPSTPFTTTQTPPPFSIYDNVDSMMNVLQEISNYNVQKDYSGESRPGLVIPPSVGPQTLHSLAQYFANELQDTDPEKEVLKEKTKEKLTSLLTAMTVHGYNNLFNVETTSTPATTTASVNDDKPAVVGTATRINSEESSDENNSVSGDSKNTEKDDSADSNDDLLTTTSLPELRQLARNFSLALSSYLHDPDNFKKTLEGLRPREPPPLDGSDNVESSTTEDELLNFSDADVKPSTPATPSATWGYIVATDSKSSKDGFLDEVKNSLNPDLHTADSQSFIPRFNNLQVDEKLQKGFTDLPPNHWTSSPQATKLWQKALSINPAVVNEQFETTPSMIASEEDTTDAELFNQEVLPDLSEPHSQISYDLRELPPLSLNSTQVHGILIDFMNHSKSDEHNRLNRILKKLNTSEEEFLDRMKEIEANPLTKRLVLLLISECGANVTQDLGLTRLAQHIPHQGSLSPSEETLSAFESSGSSQTRSAESGNRENHSLGQLVHPRLSEEDQDARALQLLNSLYTIASKFGRKR